jgi:branched-chain amino acid aminotransferase
MESELACVDGQLVGASQAVIPVTDEGLLRGDGVFEVIRLYDGRPYALDAHLARLERSAAGLRLPIDIDAIRADVALLLESRGRGGPAAGADVLVRMLVTRGGHRVVLIETMPTIAPTLALEPITYAPLRLLDGIKSLSYAANMLASRLAREEDADEALLVTPHGRVLECSTSSFFLVRDGEVWTAPLSDHVLDSITRRVVLAVATVREEPVEVDALAEAQEAFTASTPFEVSGVHRVGRHRYEAPGPRTREIAALVRERISSELR